MKLVQLKCENCGVSLKIFSGQLSVTCEHCNSTFYVEQSQYDNKQLEIFNQRDFHIKYGELEGYVGQDSEVFVPDGVTEIGRFAFKNAKGLIKVHLPEGVEIIHQYAFLGCKRLASINFPNSLKHIYDSAFSGCGLKEISLPDGIKLEPEAFWHCVELEKVEFRGSVDFYGSPFAGCTKISEVVGLKVDSSIASLSEIMRQGVELRGLIGNNPAQIKLAEQMSAYENSIEKERQARGVCVECGGEFEGLVFKKCKNCHLKKGITKYDIVVNHLGNYKFNY